VSDKRIAHVRDVLTPGQGVEVTVLAVEPDKRRVSLSMREDAGTAPPPPSRMTRDEGARPPRGRPGGGDRGEGPRRERGARPQAGSERFERRERGERGERREGADRGGDRERHERTFASSRSASEPEPLTPMQLAFKRARESAERTKASRGGGNG